jgi:hypothetical protein
VRSLSVALLTLSVALACNSGERSSGGAPSTSARSAGRPPPSAPASAPPRPPKAPKGCRVLTSSGGATRVGGSSVLSGQTLDGSEWLELPDGAKLSLRHVASAREWALLGPGKVRPCLDGEEQIALALGRVKTTVGGGARPGAEVLVFTPAGTVRYGDATLTVTSEATRLAVALEAGDAWLEPIGKSAAARPEAQKLTRSEVVSSKPNRALLEQRCAEDAQAAAEVARAMLSAPTGKVDLSKKAVSHLKARRRARLSCGETLAYAGRLEGDDRGRLLDRLSELERIWRTFPKPSGPELP